ncbi:3-hydroxyacyl-ACP dehydratase [Photobacterium proteolyticum]|uniref:3-hydroxyacyl-ACP dehydratase n=1 Tax=Photobacterium proteolyticum TaxID=1903952 RepID=A0A1Q9GIP9_9GAMM|nr:3-hydroxyacyl-ACP dehydratase [Photobacterium proteolyticum]OLQ74336.1 3-hydroxyacyl-ACP dehydratase [Photobacterium proteolyticum]
MSTVTVNKRKPTVIDTQLTNSSALLRLKVDADIVDFQGHFPSYPLLPGVTQIDWAIYYGKTLLKTPSEFGGMEAIKFQEPIRPDSIVELSLNWLAEKGKLQFSFYSVTDRAEERVTHSSGKIRLEAA